MRVFQAAVLASLVAAGRAAEYDIPSKTAPAPACTATSSSGSGAFFDLRPDIATVPEKGKSHWLGVTKDYFVRGYDYNRNFTMNICGSVLEPVSDVDGLSASQWANVSAYYESDGDVYSIGSQSMNLVSRGRKLVLQYTGGSPCGDKSTMRRRGDIDDIPPTAVEDDFALGPQATEVDSLDRVDGEIGDAATTRRKSTIISFLCDHDPSNMQATVAFVGTDPDECTYFFEARSMHACAQAEPHKPGSVGPGSIFSVILIVAVLVYVLGGVFYNRTVTHARGWRQLPNYSIWAGMWSFMSVRSSQLKPDLSFR